ncbi:hypothetical protein Cni_G03918 [Canna indica]|uniref:Uncharacterized protein n=1 Tax=Canna indica TaxID=4628 RepID=A0AAQ3JSI4_9LILI|nr:hypothetical protein Cni_G03918 [Canna indica]
MVGGFLAFFGLGRKQKRRGNRTGETREWRARGREAAAADHELAFSRSPRQVVAEKEAPWQRKARRSEDGEEEVISYGRWVAGVDVDRRAKEFIDRVHYRRMHPDQWLEAV